MLAPNLPINILEHPHTLHSLNILGSPLQEKFERIMRLAKSLFDVPIATISLIDEKCRLFKSLLGTEIIETPYEISFCGYVLSHDGIFYVPETFMDERFRNNPSVLGEPHVRFYAGYPIQLNHQKLGAVSIADNKPRYFSPDQLLWLKDVAALVETEIQNYTISTDKGKLASDLDQARMESMVDPLTSLWNRQGIYNILKYRMDEYLENDKGFAVAILDIDHFKQINDTYGHDAGDQTLKTVATCLIKGCRETDAVSRWGGEEFLILINESKTNHILEIAERIRSTLELQSISLSSGQFLNLTVTIGLTTIPPKSHPALEDLIHKADQALYQGKNAGRNQVFLV